MPPTRQMSCPCWRLLVLLEGLFTRAYQELRRNSKMRSEYDRRVLQPEVTRSRLSVFGIESTRRRKNGAPNSSQQPTRGVRWPGASAPRASQLQVSVWSARE